MNINIELTLPEMERLLMAITIHELYCRAGLNETRIADLLGITLKQVQEFHPHDYISEDRVRYFALSDRMRCYVPNYHQRLRKAKKPQQPWQATAEKAELYLWEMPQRPPPPASTS